jgi:hypothetical protein
MRFIFTLFAIQFIVRVVSYLIHYPQGQRSATKVDNGWPLLSSSRFRSISPPVKSNRWKKLKPHKISPIFKWASVPTVIPTEMPTDPHSNFPTLESISVPTVIPTETPTDPHRTFPTSEPTLEPTQIAQLSFELREVKEQLRNESLSHSETQNQLSSAKHEIQRLSSSMNASSTTLKVVSPSKVCNKDDEELNFYKGFYKETKVLTVLTDSITMYPDARKAINSDMSLTEAAETLRRARAQLVHPADRFRNDNKNKTNLVIPIAERILWVWETGYEEMINDVTNKESVRALVPVIIQSVKIFIDNKMKNNGIHELTKEEKEIMEILYGRTSGYFRK